MSDKRLEFVELPNQLPPPIDTSALPLELMHQKPVDQLLRHNDDLRARLSVQLRRGAFLEDKIKGLQSNNQSLNQHYHKLQDQLLVAQERHKNLNLRYQKSKAGLQQLERQLQQLQTSYKQLQTSTHNTTNQLQQKCTRLTKYKTRVRQLTRQSLKQNKTLKSENSILQDSVLELERKQHNSLQNIKNLQNQQQLDHQNQQRQDRRLQDEKTTLQNRLQILDQVQKHNLELKQRLSDLEQKHQLIKTKTIKEVTNANNIVTHYKSKAEIYKYECERLQQLLKWHQKQAAKTSPQALAPPELQSPQVGQLLDSEQLQSALKQIRKKMEHLAKDNKENPHNAAR